MSTQTLTAGATTLVAPAGASDLRPWAVYARKSRVGIGAHITKENQWGACTDYARAVAPGAELVYFFDNASGWDEEAQRPEWERMLTGIAAGEFAGVVAWHVDRYTRQVSVGEQLWSLCKRARTQVHTKLGGHQTSALAFTVQNAVARDESDVKSERLKLKHAQLAKDGLPHGGRRAYGYDAKRQQLVPEEAAHIKWAAQQVLAGRSLRSITAELTERGAVTVSGKPWRSSNLGTYLRQPMLAALRTHGTEDGKPKGRPIIVGDATWPEILDRGTWEAVRNLLENPERRIARRSARVYLLSGIARCGSCGGAMRGKSNASAGLGAAYFCQEAAGCAYRRADLVEAQVLSRVIPRLGQVDATGALLAPADPSELLSVQGAIAELEGLQMSLVRMRMRQEITEAQLAEGTAEANDQLAPLRAQLARLQVDQRQPAAALEGLAAATDAATWFDALGLERQRAVVRLLCTITIHPAGKGGRAYDPALVEVAWRQ